MNLFEYMEQYSIMLAIVITLLAFVANGISKGKALCFRECDQSSAVLCGVLLYMIPAVLSAFVIVVFLMRLLMIPLVVPAFFLDEHAMSNRLMDDIIETVWGYVNSILSATIVIVGNIFSFRFGRSLAK